MGKAKSRSINLCISESLVSRFDEEIDFLNLRVQSFHVDEQIIRSKSGFLKWLIGQYAQAHLDGLRDCEVIDLGESSEVIPCYLDRASEGLWNVAVKNGVAPSFNALAESALYHYFDRQHKNQERLQHLVGLYKEALQRANPAELAAIGEGL
jgi:hypothetical protein